MRAFETGTALLLLSLNGSHVVAQTQAPLPPTRSIATPSRNREMGGLSERPPPSIRAIARCERRAHCHLQTLLLAQPRKKQSPRPTRCFYSSSHLLSGPFLNEGWCLFGTH